ncbi:unnamed protein product [Brachionus calyciflorus]|uniref:Lipoprotein n=1 Tax=Brachionus calyciflorus TaxID=104777 RepID=A0A814HPF7_9BILA|nr:unnamed protein product [Brachionus calyciflorus]
MVFNYKYLFISFILVALAGCLTMAKSIDFKDLNNNKQNEKRAITEWRFKRLGENALDNFDLYFQLVPKDPKIFSEKSQPFTYQLKMLPDDLYRKFQDSNEN